MRCDACGQELSEDVEKCPYCGTIQHRRESRVTQTLVINIDKNRKCEGNVRTPPEPPEPPEKKKIPEDNAEEPVPVRVLNGWKTLAVVLLLACAAALICCWMYYRNYHDALDYIALLEVARNESKAALYYSEEKKDDTTAAHEEPDSAPEIYIDTDDINIDTTPDEYKENEANEDYAAETSGTDEEPRPYTLHWVTHPTMGTTTGNWVTDPAETTTEYWITYSDETVDYHSAD